MGNSARAPRGRLDGPIEMADVEELREANIPKGKANVPELDLHDGEAGGRSPSSSSQSSGESDDVRHTCRRRRLATWVGSCCLLFAACLGGWFAFINYLTGLAIQKMLTIEESTTRRYCRSGLDMSNITANLWWPGCEFASSLSDVKSSCTQPCYSPDLIVKMDAFNKANPGKLVTYKSRARAGLETVELTGWWLPAPAGAGGEPAPRVVLQHGFKSNSNEFRNQLLAYMMRSLGFSVLLNNFRDHCYSANSSVHIYQWGHAYPYDLLGAWDFARSDPIGDIGGPLPAEKVGLMGLSLGAMTTANAFGIEGAAPAAWMDSAPFVAGTVFAHGARITMTGMGIPPFIVNLAIPQVWDGVQAAALQKGVDLDELTPAKTLPQGASSGRPVYVVGNRRDNVVPYAEMGRLLEVLKAYPDKYDVKGVFDNDGECDGNWHCVDHLRVFDDYRQRLCVFWNEALGRSAQYCPRNSGMQIA